MSRYGFLMVGCLAISMISPNVGFTQAHIFVDFPSGQTFSDTTDPAPSATIGADEWATIEGFGSLTGSSIRPVATSDFSDASGEWFEVTIEIPEDGEWWLWASANFPFPDANTFFVINDNDEYISSPDGPSVDPAPFLGVGAGQFGTWVWGGAPAGELARDENSIGASLGSLSAGTVTLRFLPRDSFEGVSGGSGAGADPTPEPNPHIEMIYLSNGGSEDRPSNEQFLNLRPFSGNRSMNPPVYPAFGGFVDVTVQVQPRQLSGESVVVTETVPGVLRISNVMTSTGSASIVDDNAIEWEIPSLSGEETLTYRMQIDSSQVQTFRIIGAIANGDDSQAISGQSELGLLSFFIFETFSYPFEGTNENEGNSLTEVGGPPLGGGLQPLDSGWASFWMNPDNDNNQLSTRIIDAGLVESQPQEFNPGNFSLQVTGEASSGVRRQIEPVNFGEVWLSFTFVDEGPAEGHWAGLTLYNSDGNEVSFVGKPFNSSTAGIGNLPDGDSLSDVDYTVPNHYLVRYVLDPTPGQNDSVYLWVNPDENDTLATYDAGGLNNDDISDIAEIRLRRGEGGGSSSWWDNIFISSVPALPPDGSGRAEFFFSDPDNRPAPPWPVWDVISMDQFDDAITGQLGFGHDNGNNHYLIISGYLYFQNANLTGEQLVGFGLPVDRISGLNGHVLGPFNLSILEQGLRNSFKFQNNDNQRGPFTVDIIPPGNYAEVRAAMTVGNGDGELFATFNYADGTTQDGVFHADDWFNNPPNLDFDDTFQLVNGMNRLDGGNNFDGRFNPSVTEHAQQVDATKVLESVTLEFNPGVAAGSAYNLLSMFAVTDEAVTAIHDWSLF